MKKFLAFITIVIVIGGCASWEPIATHEGEFKEIIEVSGKSKEEIYSLSNLWLADTYVSSKSVIEYSDKEAGIIKGNAITRETSSFALSSSNIKYSIKIECKDSKARITFSEPHYYSPQTGEGFIINELDLSTYRAHVIETTNSYKSFLANQKTDW